MALPKTNPPWTWFIPLLAWLAMLAAVLRPGGFLFVLGWILSRERK